MHDRKHLFIWGCARSGTTAMLRALNSRSEVAIGAERYLIEFENTKTLSAEHFTPERFLDPQPDECYPHCIAGHMESKQDFASEYAKAIWVGDKYPSIFEGWENLAKLPGASFLILVRKPLPVALSYQARLDNNWGDWAPDWNHQKAISHWNESFVHFNAMLDAGVRVLPLFYEELYQNGLGWHALTRFLGIKNFDQGWIDQQKKTAKNLTPHSSKPAVEEAVALQADYEAYRTFRDRTFHLSADPD